MAANHHVSAARLLIGCAREAWPGLSGRARSMVQNGKFSDGMPIFVSTLNSVDLPTFGKPTIPICKQRHNHVLQGTR